MTSSSVSVSPSSHTGDLIDALGELQGVTITVRHELHAAAMRLMDTLGVTVVIDPYAEPCQRYVVKGGKGYTGKESPGHVSTRMCGKCRRVEEGRA